MSYIYNLHIQIKLVVNKPQYLNFPRNFLFGLDFSKSHLKAVLLRPYLKDTVYLGFRVVKSLKWCIWGLG